MNPQLLNSEIHLNMAKISDQFKTYGKSTIEHRKEIGSRLEKVHSYLSSCQKMICDFQKENTLRINQLSDQMKEGTDLTVSIQKLMQLSINKEEDIGVLKDTKEEETRMEILLQDLKNVELLPGFPAPEASRQRIRKELEYSKYVKEVPSSEWAVSFLNALNFDNNRITSNPLSTNNLVRIFKLQEEFDLLIFSKCLSLSYQFSSNSSATTSTSRPGLMDGSTSTYFQFPTPPRTAFFSPPAAPTAQIPTATGKIIIL